MDYVCSTLEATWSVIKGWLQAGYDLAANAIKWVWEQACSLLKAAFEFVRDIFQRLIAHVGYRWQKTSVEVNGTKVEVRH